MNTNAIDISENLARVPIFEKAARKLRRSLARLLKQGIVVHGVIQITIDGYTSNVTIEPYSIDGAPIRPAR